MTERREGAASGPPGVRARHAARGGPTRGRAPGRLVRGGVRTAALVALGIAGVAAAVVVAAWVASPGVGDLPARLAARERAVGVTAPVPLTRVAPIMQTALVATEDERFYGNHGIDVLGIARALPYDLAHLSYAQGASTITEQLAKLLYLGGNDHSPWLKLKDMVLALRISDAYSKAEVLDGYLNIVYFGQGAYGIRAAAERYFGVSPGRLTLSQASLLAGLVAAPSAYDPVLNPAAARERQVVVLRSLVRDGYASPVAADAALAAPLPLRGARALSALAGATITVPAAFAWGRLALGGVLALLGAAVGAAILRRADRVTLRAAGLATGGAILLWGAILSVDSFRAI